MMDLVVYAVAQKAARLIIAAVLIAVGIGAILGYALAAEENCAPLPQFLAGLRGKFGEAPLLRGVTANGTMMITTFNSQSGSWSILEVTPDMKACMRANGESLEPIPFAPSGADS